MMEPQVTVRPSADRRTTQTHNLFYFNWYSDFVKLCRLP